MRLNIKLMTLTLLICLLIGSINVFAQIEVPIKAELPVALTNPGQSPESAIVGLLAKRLGLEITSENFLKPEQLEGMNSLILILGGSGKGLGAAGVDLDAEVDRANSLIEYAQENGITIIGMHIGGSERLGDNSMVMIDTIAHQCDYLVVREDGNKDDLFTNIAEENDIPLTLIEKTTETSDVLEGLFLEEETVEEVEEEKKEE